MQKIVVAATLVLLLTVPMTPVSASSSFVVTPPDSETYVYGLGDDSGTSSYLGVDISDVSAERTSALKLKEEQGVEITTVDQDSPAGKSGLKVHDVILSMNGTAIESEAQIRRMIHETLPGRTVSLGISRDGQPMTVKVQLGDRRKALAWSRGFALNVPAVPAMPTIPMMSEMEFPGVMVLSSSARNGLAVENLTPQLGEFFGVKSGRGVLIRSVNKGSPAEHAGFHAGDVIVRINEEKIDDTSDFSRALRALKNNKASVAVIREKREQNLMLTLPERNQSEMEEESFEIPELDAQVEMQLADVETKVAELQPQIEVQIEKVMRDLNGAPCPKVKIHGKMELPQLKLQKQMEKVQKDMKSYQASPVEVFVGDMADDHRI